MNSEVKKCLDLAREVIEAQGHVPDCPFAGCICGSVKIRKVISAEFWVAYRNVKRVVREDG